MTLVATNYTKLHRLCVTKCTFCTVVYSTSTLVKNHLSTGSISFTHKHTSTHTNKLSSVMHRQSRTIHYLQIKKIRTFHFLKFLCSRQAMELGQVFLQTNIFVRLKCEDKNYNTARLQKSVSQNDRIWRDLLVIFIKDK